jgi:hypothetical protein
MMQILDKVFMENGDRPHFRRLLFWNNKGRAPILLVNGQERATVPSMKKGAEKKGRALFSPVLPLVYRLLDLTKIRG